MFPTNIKSGLKSALLLGASTAAVGLSIPMAYADEVETVVVTGSRIPNRDFTSDSPIATISAESLKSTGAVEVTQMMNTLPQVVPAFSAGSNNPPSGGQQQVDLRGLGPNRAVVLMDGRRMAPSNINGTVDIQTVPQALIARIEVVTGGESAVYGPDAITGVVNFIMKDDFEGAEAGGQYGISERGDAITENAYGTIGGNFADGKGNAVITFDWAHRNPVNDSQRGFASQATTATSFFPDGVYRPNGANLATQASYDTYFAAHGGAAPFNGSNVGVGNRQALVVNPDGSLFNAGGLGTDGVFNIHNDPTFPAQLFCADPSSHTTCQTYSYNFQPPNLLILPLNRRNLFGQAHYDINQYVTAYGEIRFTSYHSASSLAPSPAPTTGVTFTDTHPGGGTSNCGPNYCVPTNNPFIPAALATILATRTGDAAAIFGSGATEPFQIRTRFLQEGPRLQDNGINAYQVTGGLKGTLPWWDNALHYDVFASYGNNDTLLLQFGNVANSAVERMLFGLANDGPCAAIAGGFCGYDWAGANQASPESMAYAARIAKNSINTTFTDIEATVGGDLVKLPAGAMAFSIGGDYREQTYNFIPDPLLSSGDISGFNGGQAVAGAVYDREAFGELYVPILKDRSWAESLSITLGARYTNQANTFNGDAWTWKAEGDWAIVHGLTLRGSYNVATRMPNIGELFATTFQNNPTLADPCDTSGPFRDPLNARFGAHAADVAALCAAQSPAAGTSTFNQPTGQIQAHSGGTTALSPETADTFTVGATWVSDADSPWFSNFKASVDYWNIDLHGPIGIDFFDILYGCFNLDGSNPTYSNTNPNCARIIRSPGTGSIYYLNAFSGNLSKNQLDGIDVAVAWGLDLADTFGTDPEWGNLGLNFNGTWLHEFNVQGTHGAQTLNYAGTIGATSPIGLTTDAALPKWKASLMATWNFLDDFNLNTRITYISAMRNTLDLVGWTGYGFGTGPVTGVPSTFYFDLSGGWNVTDHLSVRAGVQNLFDQQPRIYNPSQQDGTDPATYDIVGRAYFAGVTVKY